MLISLLANQFLHFNQLSYQLKFFKIRILGLIVLIIRKGTLDRSYDAFDKESKI